jgi:magnesium chelatase family protein
MLVAATNPCRCGHAGDGDRCACSESDLARHRRRLSGPLLDRIDLLVHLDRRGGDAAARPLTSSQNARERVIAARQRQAARFDGDGASVNADMDVRLLRQHARLDEHCERMLWSACAQGMLSARGQHRVLRVARTIADLDGSARVRAVDLGTALALRVDVSSRAGRAA